MLTIALLAGAVTGALVRPGRLPSWVVPVAAVAVALGSGATDLAGAGRALRPLEGALGFLLAAVPLAVMLDSLGFFESLARILARGGRTVPGLWVLAAAATTVLNLDASVVLLTPLYVQVARRTGLSPLALGFQPVLLALLASSALPVSNLTNLIAVGHTGASPVAFLEHLGPPSLAATVVGYWCYRRAVARHWPGGRPGRRPERRPAAGRAARVEAPETRALLVGGAVVVGVLAGFVAGPSLGIAPWEVALAADLVLAGLTRTLPLGLVPWGTALVAAALGVLAEAVSAHLPVAQVIAGDSALALARTTGLAALAANLANNLPALLVAVPALANHPSCQLWAVLVGVNIGPVVLSTGALASLLWLEAMGRLGVEVKALDYTRMGLRVGLPALVVAAGVLIGLGPLLGCG